MTDVETTGRTGGEKRPLNFVLPGTEKGSRFFRAVRGTVFALGIGYTLFHLWLAGLGFLPVGAARHVHLLLAMSLIFLTVPMFPKNMKRWHFVVDAIFIALAIGGGIYIELIQDQLIQRYGNPNAADMFFGISIVVLTLEIARRMIGMAMVGTVGLFLAYAMLGQYIPGRFGHRGYSPELIVNAFYMNLDGIYGTALGVVVEFVVLFVVFGAFLQMTGAGDFFIDLAHALTGRFRGGPAMTAVTASGLMGSISGSATANVVTTGSITIPLMARLGYPRHVAAGIETAASAGGVIMPPVMGAAAFLIVAITGIPYTDIVKAAILPSLLYFFSLYAYSYLMARRYDLPVSEQPEHYWRTLGRTLLRGIPYLAPLGLLLYLLLSGYSATFAAFNSIVALVVSSFLFKQSRMGVRDMGVALERGARNSLPVSAACAAAGLIVGVVGVTGIGVKFSSLIVSGTGESLFFGIVLVALGSLVMGMELPITASYLILAVLAAPALVTLGVPLLIAHLIILWLAIDAAVTPPVCITAYVAAGIAEANPFRTGFAAWRAAKGLYVIPFLMAFTSITGNGSAAEVALSFVSGAVGLVALTAGWIGFFLIKTNIVERLLLWIIAGFTIYHTPISDVVGFVLMSAVIASQLFLKGWRAKDDPVQGSMQGLE